MANFYILKVVDHTHKVFHYRVESTPGTGRHHLQNLIAYSNKTPMSGIWPPNHQALAQHCIAHPETLEQHVIAVVDAPDNKAARQMTKDIRRQYGKLDQSMGYTKITTPKGAPATAAETV